MAAAIVGLKRMPRAVRERQQQSARQTSWMKAHLGLCLMVRLVALAQPESLLGAAYITLKLSVDKSSVQWKSN
jgi:hypothetical protein